MNFNFSADFGEAKAYLKTVLQSIDNEYILENLNKILKFLESPAKEICFINTREKYLPFYVLAIIDEEYLKSAFFTDECKLVAVAILDTLNAYRDSYVWETTFGNIHVAGKSVILRKVSKNVDSTHIQISPEICTSISDVKPICSEFKKTWINTILKFVKSSRLILKFPDMQCQEANYIYNGLLKCDDGNDNSMWIPVWEAMNIFKLRYEYAVSLNSGSFATLTFVNFEKILKKTKPTKERKTPCNTPDTYGSDTIASADVVNLNIGNEINALNNKPEVQNEKLISETEGLSVETVLKFQKEDENMTDLDAPQDTKSQLTVNFDDGEIFFSDLVEYDITEGLEKNISKNNETLELESTKALCIGIGDVVTTDGKKVNVASCIEDAVKSLTKCNSQVNSFQRKAIKTDTAESISSTNIHSYNNTANENVDMYTTDTEHFSPGDFTVTDKYSDASQATEVNKSDINTEECSKNDTKIDKGTFMFNVFNSSEPKKMKSKKKLASKRKLIDNVPKSFIMDSIQAILDFVNDDFRASMELRDLNEHEINLLVKLKTFSPYTTPTGVILDGESNRLLIKFFNTVKEKKSFQLHITTVKGNSGEKRLKLMSNPVDEFDPQGCVLVEKIPRKKSLRPKRGNATSDDPRPTVKVEEKNADLPRTPVSKYGSQSGSSSDMKTKLLEGLAAPVENDKAARMMRLMGWTGGALGVRGNGLVEPLTPHLDQTNRAGLGHMSIEDKSRLNRIQAQVRSYRQSKNITMKSAKSKETGKNVRSIDKYGSDYSDEIFDIETVNNNQINKKYGIHDSKVNRIESDNAKGEINKECNKQTYKNLKSIHKDSNNDICKSLNESDRKKHDELIKDDENKIKASSGNLNTERDESEIGDESACYYLTDKDLGFEDLVAEFNEEFGDECDEKTWASEKFAYYKNEPGSVFLSNKMYFLLSIIHLLQTEKKCMELKFPRRACPNTKRYVNDTLQCLNGRATLRFEMDWEAALLAYIVEEMGVHTDVTLSTKVLHEKIARIFLIKSENSQDVVKKTIDEDNNMFTTHMLKPATEYSFVPDDCSAKAGHKILLNRLFHNFILSDDKERVFRFEDKLISKTVLFVRCALSLLNRQVVDFNLAMGRIEYLIFRRTAAKMAELDVRLIMTKSNNELFTQFKLTKVFIKQACYKCLLANLTNTDGFSNTSKSIVNQSNSDIQVYDDEHDRSDDNKCIKVIDDKSKKDIDNTFDIADNGEESLGFSKENDSDVIILSDDEIVMSDKTVSENCCSESMQISKNNTESMQAPNDNSSELIEKDNNYTILLEHEHTGVVIADKRYSNETDISKYHNIFNIDPLKSKTRELLEVVNTLNKAGSSKENIFDIFDIEPSNSNKDLDSRDTKLNDFEALSIDDRNISENAISMQLFNEKCDEFDIQNIENTVKNTTLILDETDVCSNHNINDIFAIESMGSNEITTNEDTSNIIYTDNFIDNESKTVRQNMQNVFESEANETSALGVDKLNPAPENTNIGRLIENNSVLNLNKSKNNDNSHETDSDRKLKENEPIVEGWQLQEYDFNMKNNIFDRVIKYIEDFDKARGNSSQDENTLNGRKIESRHSNENKTNIAIAEIDQNVNINNDFDEQQFVSTNLDVSAKFIDIETTKPNHDAKEQRWPKNLFIVHYQHPKHKFNANSAVLLQTLIYKAIKTSRYLPCLKCHGIKNGGIIYTCDDLKSFDWLHEQIGCYYRILDHEEDLKTSHIVEMKINSFIKLDVHVILTNIERFYPDIKTFLWKVIQQKVFADYCLITFEVDDNSLTVIKRQDYSLYVGFDKAEISVLYD